MKNIYECTQCKKGSPFKCRLEVSPNIVWSEGEIPTTCPFERNDDIEGNPIKPKWKRV